MSSKSYSEFSAMGGAGLKRAWETTGEEKKVRGKKTFAALIQAGLIMGEAREYFLWAMVLLLTSCAKPISLVRG